MNIKNYSPKKFNTIFRGLKNYYKDKIYLIMRKSISKHKKFKSFLGVLKKIYFNKLYSFLNHMIDEIKFNKKKKQVGLFFKKFLTKIKTNKNLKKLNKINFKNKNSKKPNKRIAKNKTLNKLSFKVNKKLKIIYLKENLKIFSINHIRKYSIPKIYEKLKYKNYFEENNKNNIFSKLYFERFFKKLKLNFQKKKFFTIKKQIPLQQKKYSEFIVVMYYCDHYLFVAKIFKDKNKKLNVEKILEIPIPAQVIGDSIITNIDELVEISLDSFEVLNLSKSPILIILSSSFFKINSLKEEINENNNEIDSFIQSKSPFLPEDTIFDIEIFDNNLFNISRIIYSRKTFINSWINTLKKINNPVIGITTPGPHNIDILRSSKKIISDIEIIIDIEYTSTTIFITKKDFDLFSQKIPFGSTLYKKNELIESYFSRLTKSIQLLTNDLSLYFPEKIYVFGFGLDEFEELSSKLPYPYERFSELSKINFEFNIENSEGFLNNRFDSKLNTILGIVNQCL